MKKLFSVLSIAVLFFVNSVYAQVSVTPSITNYPNFTAAFTAIMAGTHGSAPTITITSSFTETNAAGPILTNNSPTAITSLRIYTSGVFTVTGAATVILAMGAGKAAAKGIDEFLRAAQFLLQSSLNRFYD